MNIGFVGSVLEEKDLKMKSCILKNATPERILELVKINIKTLNEILDYLIVHQIKLFRISSDFVPFGSHKINNQEWKKVFKKDLEKMGKKAKKNNIRLSMHPGQYTVLSSQNPTLIKKSIDDLVYHCEVLDLLKMPSNCKLVLHIGGVYGNKKQAIECFVKNYKTLPLNVKKRLIIENDDISYTASDVLFISKIAKIPVVFDYLHYLLNHTENELDAKKVIKNCRRSWKKRDGVQKIHYSQQDENKRLGAHSQTIDIPQFMQFSRLLHQKTDIMFEVKDKNISVINFKNFR